MNQAAPEAPRVADKKKPLISVKIEEDVYRLVKTAASWKGVSISEYLSALARPVAQRDCAKIGKQAGSHEEAE